MDKDWKRGLQRIRPGLYADDRGGLHIDEEELLEASGYPANEHNRQMIRGDVARLAGETGATFHVHDETEYVCGHCGARVKNPEEHHCGR
jgi:hypothetical protein